MTTLDGFSIATVGEFVGREFGISDWITVDQETIDKFVESTGGDQWIHVDVGPATRETPYGTTIAHGFLILSFGEAAVDRRGRAAQAINFGLGRVRFIAPVKSAETASATGWSCSRRRRRARGAS